MRLAVVLEQILAPVPGGTGRYSAELAAALAGTAPEGAGVFGWTAWHRDVDAAGVPGVSGPSRVPLPRRALAELWRRGLGPGVRGADVVHAPTLLVPPPGRHRLVVTIHDTVPWTHPDTMTPRGVTWHRAMAARAAAEAAAVVVPTAAVADALRSHLDVRGRLVVVGEGVSDRLALPDDVARRAVGLALPESPYLVSLATLEPRKGLDVLLRALARPGAPAVPLLMVGQSGWGGIDPVEVAAQLGLPHDRVRLMGRLPDADLATVLAGATALVVPSQAEGFGLPVLEGMAAGVPVVTSDDPALVEVGGGASVVTPVGDDAALARSLAEVVGDEALRRRLRDAGLERAAAFSWERTAQLLWDLYAHL